MMNRKSFPDVQLREVLNLWDNSVPVSDLSEVRLAGVYSFGKGLFPRGSIFPSETSYKYYNRLVTDDFVISQPKAWEGALARVTRDFDGWFLSPVFPTFRANRERLEPSYLEWFCHQTKIWEILQRKSRGLGARRESVSPEQFLSLEIPLPPLDEQRRIVARIEELSTKIDEARELRRQVKLESDTLCRSIIFGKSKESTKKVPMRELVRLRESDVIVRQDETYHFAGVYSFGAGVFKGQRKSGMEFAYTHLTRLKSGNFVYPKLMAWEGALGVVPPDCDGLVVSPEFPVFGIDETRVLPETLDVYFRTPSIWPMLSAGSTGTNVRRRRLNPANFLAFEIPLPPMSIQMLLREVMTRLGTIKPLQDETAEALDALMPSILSRAFSGAL